MPASFQGVFPKDSGCVPIMTTVFLPNLCSIRAAITAGSSVGRDLNLSFCSNGFWVWGMASLDLTFRSAGEPHNGQLILWNPGGIRGSSTVMMCLSGASPEGMAGCSLKTTFGCFALMWSFSAALFVSDFWHTGHFTVLLLTVVGIDG